MIPHVRGADFLVDVHHDPAFGSVPSVDELDTISTLVTQWTGLLRALALSGYRAVELFVEVDPDSATQRLVLDLATLGLGSAPVTPDGLDDVRADAPALLVAVAIDPLWPFGEPTGVPLALTLPTTAMEAIDGVFAPVSQVTRGWIGFTSDEGDLGAARAGLVRQGLDLAEVMAGTVTDTWAFEPDGHEPSGLGWLFDDRTWWFPPCSPDRLDPAARVLGDTLADVALALRTGEIDVPAFVSEQVVRKHDPRLLSPGGSFAQLTRTYSGQSPDVAVEAYSLRVASLVVPGSPSLQEVGAVLAARFTWTDAVMTMIEHGAVGAAHRLLPGVPSTSLGPAPQGSTPEWTMPQLTGQWDADASVGRFDTLLLNQAGTLVSGFWQQHHTTSLVRFEISGAQSGGDREGGPLTFTIACRSQGDVGPGLDSPGEITIELDAGDEPRLTLVVVELGTGTPGLVFAPTRSGLGGAHPTERSMAGLPEHVKARIRTLRDAPLHHTELVAAVELLRIAAVHIQRYLDERPDWNGIRDLMDDFKAVVDTEFAVFPVFLRNNELLATAAFYIKSELAALQPLGSISALSTLLQMFRLTYVWPSSLELQRIYDMEVQPEGFGNFLYQWRLIDTSMFGGGAGVSHAEGSGTFELRPVDAQGNPIGPVTSRTIDLYAHEIGTVLGPSTGPGDFEEWMPLSPSGRDIVPELDGATLSLVGFGGSVSILESTGTIEVTLSPSDDLPPLTGIIDATLIEFPLFAAPSEEIDPEDAYDRAEQVNDLKDLLKEAIEKGFEKYVEKGLKSGIKAGIKSGLKSIPVDFQFSMLDGWIRTDAGQPTKPDPAPVPISEYAGNDDTWARFALDKYELTDAFRGAIRQFLLENLPLLTGAGEVVIEGHASADGPDDYNERLSRDRAGSVLLAMYDILGPQIGIPWGDLRVRGFGSSQATGDVDFDRRVDVTIAGSIRMRS